MRRQSAVLVCAAALLLAGCQGFGASETGTDAEQTQTPDAVFTLELENETSEAESGGTNGDSAGSERAPSDPERDRLGWERGYWHNETLGLTTEDGLNESERRAVVARSMARVEFVRGLEFEERVPVDVVSREAFRSNRSQRDGPGEALTRFDNAKFEALFLIGEDRDSIAVQESTLGSSVLGYYSPAENRIVVVSDSPTPTIDEATLAHELVHAVQDQQFGLGGGDAATRDALQGRNGLVEGDAGATEARYTARCGQQWECLESESGSGSGGDRHFGLSYLLYFPYSDGPGLVDNLYERGGWAAVDDAYDEKPQGAREVINPREYPEWEPREVPLEDRSSDEWERVRPSTDRDRPDYAVVGPSAIAASLAYTLTDDYNESAVVDPRTVFNYEENGSIDGSDPYNYALRSAEQWDGGRMYVYADGSASAYVWRTAWEDEAAARTFAESWAAVIRHWGGTRTADGNWVIAEDSPFTDAVAVHVEGGTVTVVNAPSEAQLQEVYDA
ncbi:Hvo_1808 family surface protein [Haloarcula nitratireducens]|uniref:Hvo_1808 family surface protein n=1 Tax=Haloarcula nitratireducens TaxID=2487749 RepID=A0AAW4PCI3_9EURY|nr:Hvo_1808 family surface protein [Halomicroarcula nitratireducens]MBX0295619.1 Hvo_1808 family surface protein [Halomicroarcula nitratireducens]